MESRPARQYEMHKAKMTLPLYSPCFRLLEQQGAVFKAQRKTDISNHMDRIVFMFNKNDCPRAGPELWFLLHCPPSREVVSKDKPLFTSPIFHKCTEPD